MFKNLGEGIINFTEDFSEILAEYRNDDEKFLCSIKSILSEKEFNDSTKIKFILANSLDYCSNSYKTELFKKDFFDYLDKN